MSDFRSHSKQFLRNVSRAAAWMMRRNVGPRHFWKWGVLTDRNTDPDQSRPKLSDQEAIDVFKELERRDLFHDAPQAGSDAFFMRYDIEGWDKAVSDGRPIYGYWLKVKRNWFLMLIVLIFGLVVASIENRAVGLVDRGIDWIISQLKEDEKRPDENVKGEDIKESNEAENELDSQPQEQASI